METRNRVFVVLILMIIIGCTFRRSNNSEGHTTKDIGGLWFYLGSDSTYREVFYTDSCLWSYDEGGGPRFNRIKIASNDTIDIYDNGKLLNKSKIRVVSKNEFLLYKGLHSTTFRKVNNLLLSNDEMKKLLTGDIVKIQMFIDRFRTREDEWSKEKK